MVRRTIPAFLFSLALAVPALAQNAVLLVRHAERADSVPGAKPMMASDPDLSEAGRARAVSLATILKDAGITGIYTTEFKRTQQTAEPLAEALGLTPSVIKSTDAAALANALKSSKGNVLVVGHSNTVPEIIKSLGITSPVTIADDEFDNLFILTTGAAPKLIRLHYR